MRHVFWLLPGKLAGRPGPDRVPWDLAALKRGGFDAVLSINDGAGCDPQTFDAAGLDYACIPLPGNEPPAAGDTATCRSRLPRAYDYLHRQLLAGKTVLVHCGAGKDRTGLLLAYFLMRWQDASAEHALEQVRLVRPAALSAQGWETFARELLAELGAEATARTMGVR